MSRACQASQTEELILTLLPIELTLWRSQHLPSLLTRRMYPNLIPLSLFALVIGRLSFSNELQCIYQGANLRACKLNLPVNSALHFKNILTVFFREWQANLARDWIWSMGSKTYMSIWWTRKTEQESSPQETYQVAYEKYKLFLTRHSKYARNSTALVWLFVVPGWQCCMCAETHAVFLSHVVQCRVSCAG